MKRRRDRERGGGPLELQPCSASCISVLGGWATPRDPVLRTSVLRAQWSQMDPGREEQFLRLCPDLRTFPCPGYLNKHVIQVLITQLKGQNEGRRMDSLTGLRVALNSWAAVPKDKVIGRRVSNWGR